MARLLAERARQERLLSDADPGPETLELRASIDRWLAWCDGELARLGHRAESR